MSARIRGRTGTILALPIHVVGRVRIGISGWRYPPWRGVFYPKGLRQADELRFAASKFDSIEINGSFYSLQRPESYACWREAAPSDFIFAVKGSRFITHMKRLRDVGTACANFWASGLLELEASLGPILWQFPASQAFDDRFEPFLSTLPRSTREARRIARGHDARVPRPAFGSGEDRPLRHAIEVRHPSFCTPEFIAILRRHSVALVVADTARKFPYLEDVTADFVYIRLHGDEEIYRSGYSPTAIEYWARRVTAFRNGREPEDPVRCSRERAAARKARDVYVYFDNDIKVHAPFDAQSLARAVDAHSMPLRVARPRIANDKAARKSSG